jgi:hypothetical protein
MKSDGSERMMRRSKAQRPRQRQEKGKDRSK